jgi:hypothetical protein
LLSCTEEYHDIQIFKFAFLFYNSLESLQLGGELCNCFTQFPLVETSYDIIVHISKPRQQSEGMLAN